MPCSSAQWTDGRVPRYTQTGTRVTACIGSLEEAHPAAPSQSSPGPFFLATSLELISTKQHWMQQRGWLESGPEPADAPKPHSSCTLSLLPVSAILCRDSLLDSLRNIALLVESGVCSNNARVAVSRPAFRNACEPCFRAVRRSRARAERHLVPHGCRGGSQAVYRMCML